METLTILSNGEKKSNYWQKLSLEDAINKAKAKKAAINLFHGLMVWTMQKDGHRSISKFLGNQRYVMIIMLRSKSMWMHGEANLPIII